MNSSRVLTRFAPLFLIVLLSATPLSPALRERLIIWNVGQGQWLTWIHESECSHFDMGGEFAPTRRILKICGQRKNTLYLSHSDWDHIKFVDWGLKNLPELCLYRLPLEKLEGRNRNLFSVPICRSHSKNIIEVQTLTNGAAKNDLSRIFMLQRQSHSTLIPGDSTTNAERFWTSRLPKGKRINHLILGHHGSKTSTGEDLLAHLPNLRLTICSARKRRYGHPHPIVVERLRTRGIPTLSTELWGHIIIEP